MAKKMDAKTKRRRKKIAAMGRHGDVKVLKPDKDGNLVEVGTIKNDIDMRLKSIAAHNRTCRRMHGGGPIRVPKKG